MIHVAVDENAVAAFLIDSGRLSEDAAADEREVATAVERLLIEMITR